MRKRKMTVRDLQDALELDSPQSIYKWLRGNPFLPSRICWYSVNYFRFRWKHS